MTAATVLLDSDVGPDITELVYSISTRRGRSRTLDTIPPGVAIIKCRNHNRDLDPAPWLGITSNLLQESGDNLLMESGDNLLIEFPPVGGTYGAMVPGRLIAIIDETDAYIFVGYIEDFDYDWDKKGRSVVTIRAHDALGQFGNGDLLEHTGVLNELPGTRIARIISRSEIGYEGSLTGLNGAGLDRLQADPVPGGTNCLVYCQRSTKADQGRFFADRAGAVQYLDRHEVLGVTPVLSFSDTDGSGIVVEKVRAEYGTEELHFSVTASRVGGRAISRVNTTQAAAYPELGMRNLTMGNLLLEHDVAAEAMADYLRDRFSEFRVWVSQLTVNLDRLSAADRESVCELEIGDVVDLSWTPTCEGLPIQSTLLVEGVGYSTANSARRRKATTVTLRLSDATDPAWFVLDTSKLDGVDTLAY